jgi:DNA primase
LGSTFNEAKLELLSKTNRRLVFVIDKDPNGAHLAESVLKAGWEITFAPDGAEDLNNSVQRFGKVWTAAQLIKNIPHDAASANLLLKFKCRK